MVLVYIIVGCSVDLLTCDVVEELFNLIQSCFIHALLQVMESKVIFYCPVQGVNNESDDVRQTDKSVHLLIL